MKNGPSLLKSSIIITLNVGLTIWGLHLLFASVGLPADIIFLTIYTVTIRLSSVIELTPGNLGVREFVFGLLSSSMGQGAAYGIAISMMWRLITVFAKGILSLFAAVVDKSSPNPGDPAEEIDPQKKGGIFLLGPAAPFRGGISLYNTLLFNHLQEYRKVLFYTFKKQYFQWLFPGKDDRDNSSDKIELKDNSQTGQYNGTLVKRELHPLNLSSWIRAGREAAEYPLILVPWWVIFWAPYYLLFIYFAKRKNNKIVFLCHNVEEHERGMAGEIKRTIARAVLKKGDGFILHSRGEERQLNRLLKKKNGLSVVSPLPIVEIFNKNRYTSTTSREKLGISNKRKVILFFGFIREYKGLEYLLKALPIVKTYDPGILLLVVGEVWGRQHNYDRYVNMIKELDIEANIVFINRYVYNEEV
jgi:glycosyltransferase involved in cell wall biosynthesis